MSVVKPSADSSVNMTDTFTREIPTRFGVLALTHKSVGNGRSVSASYSIVIPYNDIRRKCARDKSLAGPDSEKVSDTVEVREETEMKMSSSWLDTAISREPDTRCNVAQAGASDPCSPSRKQTISFGETFESGSFICSSVGINNSPKIGPTITGTATHEEPNVCEVCGRPFRRRKDMRRHLLTHTTEKPYNCPVCLIRFKSRDYLHRHCKRIHGSELVSHPDENIDDITPNPETLASQPLAVIASPSNVLVSHCHLPLKKRYKCSGAFSCSADSSQAEMISPLGLSRAEYLQSLTQADGDMSVASSPKLMQKSQSSESSPSRLSMSSSPIPVSHGKQSLAGASFMCGICGGLMARRFVMVVMPNPSSAKPGEDTPRVVCKDCFSKKTGLLCIG